MSEVTSTNFGLNSSGDNLYIYNGTTVPASATALEWIAGFATNPFLVSGSSSSSLTFLPSVFTVGNFALSLGITVRTNTTGNIISGSMLNSIDAEPTALQLTYRATNLPSSGTLRFSSAAVVANVTSFMQNNINSCRLTYDGPSIEQTMSYR